MSGKGIYVAPSVEFVPFLYNPLYFAVSGVVSTILGPTALPLRVVSITSTFAAFGLIFYVIRREGGRLLAALCGVGLYAGTYSLSGGWFDVARVDSLCLALALGAIAVARWAATPRALIAAAILSVLSFLTKQNAVLLIGGLAGGLFALRGARAAAIYLVTSATLIGGAVLAMSVASGGWYLFYTLIMPGEHARSPELYVDFWRVELFSQLPMAFALGAMFLVSSARKPPSVRAYYGSVALSLLLAAYGSRIHSWSYVNDLISAHACLALLFGLGMADLNGWDQPGSRSQSTAASLLALGQLLVLVDDPRRWIPSPEDRREGTRTLAAIQRTSGDVYVAEHPNLAVQAGKPDFAHEMAVMDIVRMEHDRWDAQKILRASFEQAYATHRFSSVITDDHIALQPLLDRYYRPVRPHFVRNRDAFFPRTGGHIRPINLFVPR
jgi:hypothetical protein